MAKKRFKGNTEILPNNYDDFFNKVYQDGNKYKDLSDNVFDKTETRRIDFDSHNQDELTGNENPFTSQFSNPNTEDPYNEYRASNQTSLPTAAAGLGRVGSKVLREVTKTAGSLGGLGVALAENTGDLINGKDEHDFLQTTFDNAFIKGTDKLFDNANEALLPVYVSDTVKNGGFFDKVTSSEFWATEGADGVGYMISAFAPGYALKALGTGNKLFGAASKLTSLRYGKSLEVARRGLAMAGVTANKIESFVIPAANTFFEAGAESKGVGDDVEQRKPEAKLEFFKTLDFSSKDFKNKMLAKGHQLDLDRRSGKISIEQYKQLGSNLKNAVAEELFETNFKEQKSYAMRNSFLTNLAILAGPNYIQAKLLFGQNESKNLLKQLIKNPSKDALKKAGTRVLESFASEAPEELAQTSTEHRQTNKAILGKLHGGLDSYKDISPGEFATDFIKTLGTTEGQVAGFLGGFLGSGVSVVTGHLNDKKDKVENNRLLNKIKNAGTSLNDVNLDSFEKEVVKNDQGENVEVFKKDEKGNKIPNIENIQKIKKALDYHETLSEIYDYAIEEGDVETIQKVKKLAEHDLIMNFVGEDELTIDALKEHLKEILPVENEDKSKSKENQNRQHDIIEKAKYLQKELVSFQNMSASIIKLENQKATPEQVKSFMGSLQNEFLKETSLLYELRKEKQELIKDKSKLESETTLEEIDNPNFDENLSHEFDKKVISRIENPRLKIVNDKLTNLNKEIKDKESFLNFGVWNSKIVNGAFNYQLNVADEIKKATSEENTQKASNVINDIDNATEEEHLDKILKDDKDYFNDPYNQVVKSKLEQKRRDIITKKKSDLEIKKKAEEEETIRKQQESPNNGTKDDKANKGKPLEKVTESIQNSQTSDVDHNGEDYEATTANPKELEVIPDKIENKGTRLNSTVIHTKEQINNPEQYPKLKKEGEPIGEAYAKMVEYEQQPRDKKQDNVSFSIGDFEFAGNDKVENVYKKLLNKETLSDSEIKILEDYLPIKVTLAHGKESANSFLDSMSHSEKDRVKKETLPLRKAIVSVLITNNGSFDKISGKVNDQFPGMLQVVDQMNNVFDLQFMDKMSEEQKIIYFQEEAGYVDWEGVYKNCKSGKSSNDKPIFSNDKLKGTDPSRHKGEVFLKIPMNNGKSFFLKLNTNKISESKANALFNLMKIKFELEKDNTHILSLSKYIEGKPEYSTLLEDLSNEIEFVKHNSDKLLNQTVNQLIDLLILNGNDNQVTKFGLYFNNSTIVGNKGELYEGPTGVSVGTLFNKIYDETHGLPKDTNLFRTQITAEEFLANPEEFQEAFVKFFQYKRHNVLFNGSNGVSFKNKNYINYLIKQVLSTNANTEQTFGGYSNIYLEPTIKHNNEVVEVEKKLTTTNAAFSGKQSFSDSSRVKRDLTGIEASSTESDIKSKENVIEVNTTKDLLTMIDNGNEFVKELDVTVELPSHNNKLSGLIKSFDELKKSDPMEYNMKLLEIIKSSSSLSYSKDLVSKGHENIFNEMIKEKGDNKVKKDCK